MGRRVGPVTLLPSDLRSAAKSGCACSAERRGLRSFTVEPVCVELTVFTEEILRKGRAGWNGFFECCVFKLCNGNIVFKLQRTDDGSGGYSASLHSFTSSL